MLGIKKLRKPSNQLDNTVRYISRPRACIFWLVMAGSTLEIDSGHTNMKIDFPPKSL